MDTLSEVHVIKQDTSVGRFLVHVDKFGSSGTGQGSRLVHTSLVVRTSLHIKAVFFFGAELGTAPT